jgi:uncharacterized protein
MSSDDGVKRGANETNRVNERIRLIDALRGLALAGIGIFHFGNQFLAFMPPPDHRTFNIHGPLDGVIEALLQIFIVGKGFALFSLMFGLSFAIQMQRAEARDPRGDFRYRFAWRLAVLFGIGFLHSLFFAGDILTVYALLGLPMLLFYRVGDRWLLALALVLLIGTPRVIQRVIVPPATRASQKVMMTSMEEAGVRHWQALESGDLAKIVRNNVTEGLRSKWEYQTGLMGRGYQTFALFLVGLWAGRRRIFENLESHRGLFKRLLRWTGGLTVALPVLMIALFMIGRAMGGAQSGAQGPEGGMPDFGSWQVIAGVCIYDAWNNLMTLFYVAAFVVLFERRRWQALALRFAPVGRMALSSYLLQTVAGSFIFFGFGLGLLGRHGNSVTVPIGIAVVATLTLICSLWLRHFFFGPVEWAWRSLTWLRRQRFRIGLEPAVARAA